MNYDDLIASIPQEVKDLNSSGQLHKLAANRAGLDASDFGVDSAVGYIAKKAFLQRRINKLIQSGIACTEEVVSRA
jgi:hypothetical protein